MRLSNKDLDEKKSMNNHLHLLEAYTNLYRVWPDDRVRARLLELIEVFTRRILDQERLHFHHFFDETWQIKSSTYNFGHDIEASWLLCEAAFVVGEQKLRSEITKLAVAMVSGLCKEAFDTDGGLFYAGEAGLVIDDNKEWWPQAEAVVGLINAYQISNQLDFLEVAWRCWQFIDNHIVDKVHGEWFWRVSRDREADINEPKISEWKGPYHNGRACFELLRRLDPA
jgi:mannobiose 2-epimerase